MNDSWLLLVLGNLKALLKAVLLPMDVKTVTGGHSDGVKLPHTQCAMNGDS